MKHTEEEPMKATVTGTVVVTYNAEVSDKGMTDIKWYLSSKYNFDIHDVMLMDSSTLELQGMYLDRCLYSPANHVAVHNALWVLSDVLGNVELGDWHSEVSKPVYIESVGDILIHTGNFQHMDVALRVLVIQPL